MLNLNDVPCTIEWDRTATRDTATVRLTDRHTWPADGAELEVRHDTPAWTWTGDAKHVGAGVLKVTNFTRVPRPPFAGLRRAGPPRSSTLAIRRGDAWEPVAFVTLASFADVRELLVRLEGGTGGHLVACAAPAAPCDCGLPQLLEQIDRGFGNAGD